LSCLGIIEKAFAHVHLQAIRGWSGEISGLGRNAMRRTILMLLSLVVSGSAAGDSRFKEEIESALNRRAMPRGPGRPKESIGTNRRA
jgi:hypothetical protein